MALLEPQDDERARVLKQDETFGVYDRHGDIHPRVGGQGLYHEEVRYLSRSLLLLEKYRPLLLSSHVSDDGTVLSVDLTNPELHRDGVILPRGTLHIHRSKRLWQGCCYETLDVTNYGPAPIAVGFTLDVEADFADIFEVRGASRARRGEMLKTEASGSEVILGYHGRDGTTRRTRVILSSPGVATASLLRIPMTIAPGATERCTITVACELRNERIEVLDAARADEMLAAKQAQARARMVRVVTSNAQFNALFSQCTEDLRVMSTSTPDGLYPYAGVPWLNCAFGRQGLITALESLWVDPELARGVLGFLAATQATRVDDATDAQPGRILHEARRSEMARVGEVPFGRYYGSVDATPLFVMLAGAYVRYTGDLELGAQLLPNVERALTWMDAHGDVDGDGLIEDARGGHDGRPAQGWRDSPGAIFHADGTVARGPVALVEVQAYAYGAWRAAASLARALGNDVQSDQWRRRAETVRRKVETAFWNAGNDSFALALDGEKRQCLVRGSSVGHALFTGLASPERAPAMIAQLMDERSFTGWGIRTVAAGEVRHNPMSAHNGAVWPHDTALIACGLSRYGAMDAALALLTGLVDASTHMESRRLPEMFCGFARDRGKAPTLFPGACVPFTPASASICLMFASALGLRVDGKAGVIELRHPRLPPWLRDVELQGLHVGSRRVDLVVHRVENSVRVEPVRGDTGVTVKLVP